MKFQECIANAVAVFRSSPHLRDQQLLDELVKNGVEPELAERLVEFLPMAYCRVIFSDSGVRFPDTFRRLLENGDLREQTLSSEPAWQACFEVACAEAQAGVKEKDLLLIAAHSAEFDAINQLLNQGSNLSNLVLTVPVFRWQRRE